MALDSNNSELDILINQTQDLSGFIETLEESNLTFPERFELFKKQDENGNSFFHRLAKKPDEIEYLSELIKFIPIENVCQAMTIENNEGHTPFTLLASLYENDDELFELINEIEDDFAESLLQRDLKGLSNKEIILKFKVNDEPLNLLDKVKSEKSEGHLQRISDEYATLKLLNAIKEDDIESFSSFLESFPYEPDDWCEVIFPKFKGCDIIGDVIGKEPSSIYSFSEKMIAKLKITDRYDVLTHENEEGLSVYKAIKEKGTKAEIENIEKTVNYYSLFRPDEQGETKLHKLAQNEDQHSDFFSLLEKIPYEDKYQVLMFENNDRRSSYSLMHDKGSDEDVARLDFILGEALYDITENTDEPDDWCEVILPNNEDYSIICDIIDKEPGSIYSFTEKMIAKLLITSRYDVLTQENEEGLSVYKAIKEKGTKAEIENIRPLRNIDF